MSEGLEDWRTSPFTKHSIQCVRIAANATRTLICAPCVLLNLFAISRSIHTGNSVPDPGSDYTYRTV
jgi:hypothetical protein